MRRFTALLVIAFALLAPSARAADTVVATSTRATPVDAFGGRAVWSTWDPAIGAYRLTESFAGQVRTLPVAPNAVPFDVDLGPDASGATVAVYSRCTRPPASGFAIGGHSGCDIRLYSFATGRERTVSRANSSADEYWPTVWGPRIAFTRTYAPGRRFLYWRPLDGTGASQRLDRGPTDRGDAVPSELDMRAHRVTFAWQFEYGAQVRVDTLGGSAHRLAELPGSGAAVNTLHAQGPTIGADRRVYWMLAVGEDAPVYSDFRRNADTGGHHERATMRVSSDANANRFATTGYARDSGTDWYVHAVSAGAYEIRAATGLRFVPTGRPSAG